MIPDSAIPEGGARSLVMSDVRRIAGGLDAVLANDGTSDSDLSEGRVDFAGIRDRLAAVGVALGSDVSAPVFEAAKTYWKSSRIGNLAMTIAVLAMAIGLGVLSYRDRKSTRRNCSR